MLSPYKSLLVYFFVVIPLFCCFSPDTSSFDAYGLKIAANEILLVESLPFDSSFFVRLSPFNYSLSCTIVYNDSHDYVYAVSVGSEVTVNDIIRFVFIGVNMETNVPFLGSLIYTGVSGITYVNNVKPTRKSVFLCDGWKSTNYRIHQLNQFASDDIDESSNNDFFIVTVSPKGDFAYAFTKSFVVVYDVDHDNVSSQFGNITWPDPSFLPHAVDVSQDFLFVIIGYVGDSDTKYTPCAYLLNITNFKFHVLDTWLYTPPTNTSWQTTLTNWDADVYAAKYDMSVTGLRMGWDGTKKSSHGIHS